MLASTAPSRTTFTRPNLNAALKDIGLLAVTDLFDHLAAAYGGPERHYHNRAHIEACLTLLAQHKRYAQRTAEMAVALWFHDFVYDSRRQDNEEQSAVSAETFLTQHNVNRNTVQRIGRMIRATQHHRSDDPDTALLLDIDLAILGAPPTQFDAYDDAIRREYAWVSHANYVAGRLRVLETFAARDPLYHTEPFQRQYAAQARANFGRKISDLREQLA